MDSSLAARIDRVKAKVRQRGLHLGPCLGEAEVDAFEHKHRISLPSDYREFILRIGNGGPGPPHYGCAPLGEPANDMRDSEVREWTELPNVCKPFPFTMTWVWEDGDLSDAGTADQRYHGCIYIGNDGCGAYWFLIVTGIEAGNVWMICGEGMQPTMPKRDFLQWYEDWLDGVRDWWA